MKKERWATRLLQDKEYDDNLNDYCNARGRAKFVADWLPAGREVTENLWGSHFRESLGFRQLPHHDIERITEDNHG